MRHLRIVTLMLFASSCTEIQNPKLDTSTNPIDWKTRLQTHKKHVYSSKGQLDTTHQTLEYYVNGLPGLVEKSMIVRKYDNRKRLLAETTIELGSKNNSVSEQVSFRYDEQNNLIEKVELSYQTLIARTGYFYNSKNQRTKTVKIEKLPDQTPPNWNIDSVIKHQKDKINHSYDTTTIFYSYDEKGLLIREQRQREGKTTEIHLTQYLNNGNISTVSFNGRNDTTTISITENQGNVSRKYLTDKSRRILFDTSIYENNRLIEHVMIDRQFHLHHKENFKYDAKGNEVEYTSYH